MSSVEKMRNQWRAAVFLSFLLQMCSAVLVLDCKPTRNGNGMLCNILNHSDPVEAKCDYLWGDGNTMLATNNNKTALVMRHNSSSLETSECLADVTWTQQCSQMPTGLMDFSANCSTTCDSKNSRHGDSPTTKPTDEENQSNTGIGAIIGIVVIGLIGLTIFLLYKYIPRTLHCSLIGRAYRAVKRENTEPGAIKV